MSRTEPTSRAPRSGVNGNNKVLFRKRRAVSALFGILAVGVLVVVGAASAMVYLTPGVSAGSNSTGVFYYTSTVTSHDVAYSTTVVTSTRVVSSVSDYVLTTVVTSTSVVPATSTSTSTAYANATTTTTITQTNLQTQITISTSTSTKYVTVTTNST